jgi:Glucose / Sorbosone dehydrogenase
MRRRAALVAVALVLVCAAPAAAAPTLVKIGDFSAPVHVASPPGDPRVFVVEQDGVVKIAGGATFLDVTGLTDGGGERGLLSIAFAPDYATSGLFYVFLTSPGSDYDLRVIEFRRSSDPNRADPGSARVVLSIPHPNQANHNGGQLQFGPDGMLYVGTGDGGGSHDSEGNAQRLDRLLGKILRIDPRTGGAVAGNPFNSRVWAYGLRNPWRFTFDRATGDLVIGDVGQSAFEEVDWARAASGLGRGANYGWPCFDAGRPNPAAPCSAPNAVPPTFERSHGEGFCAIIGGYVVRDPGLPTLAGRYVYSDACIGTVRSITLGGSDDRVEPLGVASPSSFGEDSAGRLYVASLTGPVFRIEDCPPAGCPSPAPAGPAADRTAPRLRVAIVGLRKAARRRHLRLRVRCDERCRVTAGGRLRGVGPLKRARRTLAAEKRTTLRMRMSRNRARRLRGALRRRGRVIVTVTVRARDGTGNERRVRRRARIRR